MTYDQLKYEVMEDSFGSRLGMGLTRRRFFHSTFHAGAALAIGRGPARSDGTDTGREADVGEVSDPDLGHALDTVACKDALAGGELVRTLRFEDEDQVRYDERWQQGWNGGLNADLSALTQENLLMPNERFFIRTTAPGRLDQVGSWRIRVHGLVQSDRLLSLEDLQPLVAPRGSFVLECSGNRGPGLAL